MTEITNADLLSRVPVSITESVPARLSPTDENAKDTLVEGRNDEVSISSSISDMDGEDLKVENSKYRVLTSTQDFIAPFLQAIFSPISKLDDGAVVVDPVFNESVIFNSFNQQEVNLNTDERIFTDRQGDDSHMDPADACA